MGFSIELTRFMCWDCDKRFKVILQSSFESKSLHCDRFNLTPRLETACHESSPQSHCKTSHCVTKRLGGRLVFYQKTPKPVDVFWNFLICMSFLWKRVCEWWRVEEDSKTLHFKCNEVAVDTSIAFCRCRCHKNHHYKCRMQQCVQKCCF